MKPGTSGLRKKVEVWKAQDEENKNYVENFIQSLLDTAVDKNGGKMPQTYVEHLDRLVNSLYMFPHAFVFCR